MNDVAVEIGSGTAPLPHLRSELVAPGSTMVYVERDKDAARLIRWGEGDPMVVLGSADHLGLPANSVDLVMLPNVWGVLSGGITKSLPEIMRVVKPGGRVVVLETAGPVPSGDVEMEMKVQGTTLERKYSGREEVLGIFSDRELMGEMVTTFSPRCFAMVFRKAV